MRREEMAGLALAVAAHVALVAWLALKPPMPAPLPVPERMTVTLSDDVAERSTSPEPRAEAAPAIAPVLAEVPAPAPQPIPQPQIQPPRPALQQPPPKPQPAPKPQPVTKAPAKPAPQPSPQLSKPQAKPAGGGGSRIGSDFLKGIAGGQTPGVKAETPPTQSIGPAVRSALAGAIARQLKPKWVAPQGADADQLVTVLDWDLNQDGSLAGPPRLVTQLGVNESNKAQAKRHAEMAIRAVQLAAPFELPSELYPAWRHIRNSRFDRNAFK